MATQIPYHQRKSQRLKKQQSSSLQTPLFGNETMATKEGNAPAQGRSDMLSAARNLRRMKRRLLMQVVQVHAAPRLPELPDTPSAKPSTRSLKKRPTRVSKKKVAGANTKHSRNTSCFF
jgi:hypothetical protein